MADKSARSDIECKEFFPDGIFRVILHSQLIYLVRKDMSFATPPTSNLDLRLGVLKFARLCTFHQTSSAL